MALIEKSRSNRKAQKGTIITCETASADFGKIYISVAKNGRARRVISLYARKAVESSDKSQDCVLALALCGRGFKVLDSIVVYG